jgi:hypothetical protein
MARARCFTPGRSVYLDTMSVVDTITLTLPRQTARAFPALAQGLLDRMHELLERNTDGALNERERAEVKALAEMAQFAQVVAMAICILSGEVFGLPAKE